MDKILLVSLFFLTFSTYISAQTKFLSEIKATVKDQDNIPLAGMSLFIEGENFKQTAVSDENGIFSIKLPSGKFTIKGHEVVSKNFLTFLEIFEDKPNPTNFDLIIETNQPCCSATSEGKPTEVIKYVFPAYPPAAKAVRAIGETIVAVKIDKEGKVTMAKAERAHPLLRTTSETSARNFLFTKDEYSTERDGKIVFAFVPCSEKSQPNSFKKPNRLEIKSGCPIIYTSVSY